MIESPVLIKGTYGHEPEYLVVHKGDNVCLAMKPVVEFLAGATTPKAIFGVRIRAAAIPGKDIQPDNVGAAALVQYPGVPFDNVKATHASLFLGIGIPLNLFPGPQEMWDGLKKNSGLSKTWDALSDLFLVVAETGTDIEHTYADIQNYLDSHIESQMMVVIGKVDDSVAALEEPVKELAGPKVVDLFPDSDTKH